jgi:AraC-like DNA-binding protein
MPWHDGAMTAIAPWTPSDPLGETLHLLRMRGVFYCRTEARGPWALEIPAIDDSLSFHVVTVGTCWLVVPGEQPLELRANDLALIPHGRGHVLASDPSVRPAGRVDQVPQRYLGEHYSVLTYGGSGRTTRLVCGVVTFEEPAARDLIRVLPRVIHVDATATHHPSWIHETIRLMAAELAELRPGGEAVTTRLADVLVIQAVRDWLEREPMASTGWLGALRDARIGGALAALHREPGRAWTLQALAREAGMSRSAFAARFSELVGEPPMTYVTRWRMQLAHERLAAGEATVTELAGGLGYHSPAAFTRAFTRVMGTTPGALRRR